MHWQEAIRQSARHLAIRTDNSERTFIRDPSGKVVVFQLYEPTREARSEEIEGFLDWKPLNE